MMSLATKPPANQRAEQARLAGLLLAARRRQKLSLSRLAKALYVPKDVLQAIEVWDEPNLPDEPFLSALLARYASELGVKVRPRPARSPRQVKAAIKRPPIFLSRVASWGGGGLLALAILLYVGWLSLELIRPPVLHVSSPPDATVTSEATVMVQGHVAHDTALRVAGQPVSAAADGSFATEVSLRGGLNDIEITAVNSLGHQRTLQRTVYRR